MKHRGSLVTAGVVIVVGVTAGVVAWKRGEAQVTPAHLGTEATRDSSGFLDVDNLEALLNLMTPEKRRIHDEIVRTMNHPPEHVRFRIIYHVLPDRFSGDPREIEPFVRWIEEGVVRGAGAASPDDDPHRESRAIGSMWQMGIAEAVVGLSADHRRRMLEQIRRWSTHDDDDIQGHGLFYLWVLKEKGEKLPAWHERWLADGLKNEYWATKIEVGKKSIERAKALRKGTPLER